MNLDAKNLLIQEFLMRNSGIAQKLGVAISGGNGGIKGEPLVERCLGLLPLKPIWKPLNLAYKLNYIGSALHKVQSSFASIIQDLH